MAAADNMTADDEAAADNMVLGSAAATNLGERGEEGKDLSPGRISRSPRWRCGTTIWLRCRRTIT